MPDERENTLRSLYGWEYEVVDVARKWNLGIVTSDCRIRHGSSQSAHEEQR